MALAAAVGLLSSLIVGVTPSAEAAPVTPVPVAADAETVPVSHSGDAADDPAIWRDDADPSRSLIIGNDKQGSLDVYGLDGSLKQRITTGTKFWGNVDVRQGVDLGSGAARVDLVAAYNAGLRLYSAQPSGLTLATDGSGAINTSGGEGLCLYTSAVTGRTSAFVITITGTLRQYLLSDTDRDGLVDATLQRSFQVGSEAEGCVADDDTGALYVSEEDVALWRYGAEPGAGTARTMVDSLQPTGNLVEDVEGVTLVDLPDGSGAVIVSAQNVAKPLESYFSAYSRTTGTHLGTFRVVAGDNADGCSRTDGVTALAQDLGPAYPSGVFICQDDQNTAPGTVGNQDFKLVRLERILALWPDDPNNTTTTTTSTTTTSTTTTSTTTTSTTTPPSSTPPAFVAARSSNGNRTRHSVTIPNNVATGDTLVALIGTNTSSPISDPPGWTRVGSVNDSIASGRLWTRTATASDAGSTLAVSTSAITKSDLTVAAYRGTLTPTVSASAGSVQVYGPATHTTPRVDTPSSGLVVSYWADRTSSAVSLTVGAPQTIRTSSLGTGGGRVAAALADSGTASGPGQVGGVTATGTTSTSRTVMFTVVLSAPGTPPTNQPPVASATASCNAARCSFDGSASSDDGTIRSYDWTFGDGSSGTGRTTDHDYTTAGPFTATLTVTDDMGATASTTVVVDPVVEPPTGQVVPTFVGGASTNGNRQVHSVTIPAGTRAGDLLLAFYGGNTNAAPTGPTGWSQLSTVGDGSSQGRAWSRVAGPTDAGSTLSVTTTAYTKSDLTVLVYRGGTGVTASHGRLDVDSGASHAAPVISSNGPVLAVSYWADRSSSAIALTVAGQTVRSSSLGTGGGRIAAAAADNATLAGPGPVGGAVATGTSSSSRLMSFTVLVGAGVG